MVEPPHTKRICLVNDICYRYHIITYNIPKNIFNFKFISSECEDIWRNPSFMLSTLGFTCVAFVTGALAWWGPKFMWYGLKLQAGGENVKLDE